MSDAVRNPEQYCPICGYHLPHNGEHRCAPRALRALDDVPKRDHAPVRGPNISQRLQDGFQFAGDMEETDNELMDVCPACKGHDFMHWF